MHSKSHSQHPEQRPDKDRGMTKRSRWRTGLTVCLRPVRAFYEMFSTLYEPSPPYPRPLSDEEAMRQDWAVVGECFHTAMQDVYEQLPEEQRTILHSHLATDASSDSEAPQDLQAYDRIVPGLAVTIVERVKQQADHRRDIETATTHAKIKDEKRKHWMAYLAALCGLAIAGVLVIGGHGWASIGTAILGLSPLVGQFIGWHGKEADTLGRGWL